MPTDDELINELSAALEPPHRPPPTERINALRAAATAQAATAPAARPVVVAHRRPLRIVVAALAGAAAAVGAFALGATLRDSGDPADDLLAGGALEFEADLIGPDGRKRASATGVLSGIGRTVQFRSDDLPVLPQGEFYELWFVGPGDSTGSPNRISAGTFHPDEQGRADVDLTAAVDPQLYPELVVTAEPGDGNPAPTGPEVLRAEIVLED